MRKNNCIQKMSSNLSVVLDRLTKTIYDLDNRKFINRRVVNYDDTIKALGTFSKAILRWNSTDKDGKSPVDDGKIHVLLIGGSSAGDYASVFESNLAAVERYNTDCSSFVLTSDDLESTTPIGVQRYYITRKNRLEILETLLLENNTKVLLNRFTIGKEYGTMKLNTFTLADDSVATLDDTSEVDAGVCPCDYSCGSSKCCKC